jgi:hypothetical protein
MRCGWSKWTGSQEYLGMTAEDTPEEGAYLYLGSYSQYMKVE